MIKTFFDDVESFHAKFDLPTSKTFGPELPPADIQLFRLAFLYEEVHELQQAWARGDLAEYADAIADLIFVAAGTAAMAGIPLNEVWSEVVRANLTKERAIGETDTRSKRKHASDVVKPRNFTPPNHWPAIDRAIERFKR